MKVNVTETNTAYAWGFESRYLPNRSVDVPPAQLVVDASLTGVHIIKLINKHNRCLSICFKPQEYYLNLHKQY